MVMEQLTCAGTCVSTAGIGLAEGGAIISMIIVLIVSAFWPARSA